MPMSCRLYSGTDRTEQGTGETCECCLNCIHVVDVGAAIALDTFALLIVSAGQHLVAALSGLVFLIRVVIAVVLIAVLAPSFPGFIGILIVLWLLLSRLRLRRGLHKLLSKELPGHGCTGGRKDRSDSRSGGGYGSRGVEGREDAGEVKLRSGCSLDGLWGLRLLRLLLHML